MAAGWRGLLAFFGWKSAASGVSPEPLAFTCEITNKPVFSCEITNSPSFTCEITVVAP